MNALRQKKAYLQHELRFLTTPQYPRRGFCRSWLGVITAVFRGGKDVDEGCCNGSHDAVCVFEKSCVAQNIRRQCK